MIGARLVDRAMEATVVLSFTRVGHDVRSRLFNWTNDLDGHGKLAVITGATSGLGLEAAVQLAAAGAHVHFLARNAEKAERVRAEIVEATGNTAVTYGIADLADLAQVHAFAQEIQREHGKIDALIHNAGLLLADRVVTTDGMEFTWQTQVVAPTLLTSLLLPSLRAASGRVIFVSSGGLYSEKLRPETVEMDASAYDGTRAYARAKRAQLALTHLWAQWLRDDGITVNAMHPGWADTPGVEAALPGFRKVMGPLLRTPEDGADTAVWLATQPDQALSPGAFYLDRRPRGTVRWPGTATSRPDRHRLRSIVDAQAGLA